MFMNKNIKIGVIGGAGPLASGLLYEKLVKYYYEKINYSKDESAYIVMLNALFNYNLLSDYNKTRLMMQELINDLYQLNITHFVIACNSLHAFLDELDFKGMQLIHMPNEIQKSLNEINLKKVFLIGSSITKSYSIYKNREVFYLDSEEQEIVSSIINQILKGIISDNQREIIIELINKKISNLNIDGIILGCTELSVLNNNYKIKLKNENIMIIDSVDLLAKKIIYDLYN